MDPRLQGENLAKIAAAAGLQSGEYEVLDYAGPSLWMTEPHESEHAKSFWWLLEHVSLPVHRISQVVVVGHSNCGGFALKGAPQEAAAEKQHIVESLKAASAAIKTRHPELEVVLLFVQLGQADGASLPEVAVETIA